MEKGIFIFSNNDGFDVGRYDFFEYDRFFLG